MHVTFDARKVGDASPLEAMAGDGAVVVPA